MPPLQSRLVARIRVVIDKILTDIRQLSAIPRATVAAAPPDRRFQWRVAGLHIIAINGRDPTSNVRNAVKYAEWKMPINDHPAMIGKTRDTQPEPARRSH